MRGNFIDGPVQGFIVHADAGMQGLLDLQLGEDQPVQDLPFQHPFGRVVINGDIQFLRVIAYIHQNPQKHGFVDDFRTWKYSSYEAFLSKKPTYLKRAAVLSWFGNKKTYTDLHAEWVNEMQSKVFAGNDDD